MTDSRRHALSQTGSSASTLVPSSDGHYSSGSTKRFRETIETIPSPEEELEGRRPKPYEPPYAHVFFLFGTPIIFITMGVVLEIATRLSDKQGGFKVPTVNVFGTVSGQFLASIIPTLIILPYAIMYRSHDWVLRWFQPYIILQRGGASAEESLLLDYVFQGPFFSLFRALKYKHRVLFLSSFTALVTYSFQPLAGSIFQIRQTPQTERGVQIMSTESISLADQNETNSLNGFLAASGYVEAAALHGLGDPPFVFNNWTTSAFVFPKGPGLNGTITVNTTAISTIVNCANPAQSVDVVPTLPPGNFTFNSASVEGCTPGKNITLNPQSATQQYGVVNVTCPDQTPPEDDVMFQPVMFWFFQLRDQETPEAKTIFCHPKIVPFNVTASAHLEDGTLDSCAQSASFDIPNNVTGPPNNGKAYNGLFFSENPDPDPFIDARAKAISSGVPGTIFRTALRKPEGLQAIFDLPNGMLDITSRVYTQHLTVSAKSIYFRKNNNTVNAEQTFVAPRLWIDPLPAHFLAFCLCAIGVTGLFTHFLNLRQRRNLLLAAPPGSIASITALTARSGFGELILPYDDEATLEKKLDGIKFRLDKRTGAIVADDAPDAVPGMGRDDAMLSLLGRQKLHQHSVSSQAAFQTAVGYPPWVYKTPYDD